MQKIVHFLTKKQLLCLLFLLPAWLLSCVSQQEMPLQEDTLLLTEEATEKDTPALSGEMSSEETLYYVHVCGAVAREGVYALSAGARVFDAVDAAGGLLDTADGAAVNLAQPVTDGIRIRIPFAGEDAAEVPGDGDRQTANGCININTATLEELRSLNGIGEKRAREIIRYRETHGAFLRIEDIMQVDGIREKLFEQIRERITV
ncbi:MAG: helix-hairpin-helix domain-containing protein [Lachnospiraceae bacterium]|nr:helix-hairpin-helix domain-containing protein [Lachnospiraceae bacterium]